MFICARVIQSELTALVLLLHFRVAELGMTVGILLACRCLMQKSLPKRACRRCSSEVSRSHGKVNCPTETNASSVVGRDSTACSGAGKVEIGGHRH